MLVKKEDTNIYEFDGFRLEIAERRVSRGGERIALQPKTFDLLLVLVRHAGQLRRKQDLMEEVWGDAAVEEANLTKNIGLLRKALGTRPDGNDYIETIPRFGYRFDAEVQTINGSKPELVVERFTITNVVTEEFDVIEDDGLPVAPGEPVKLLPAHATPSQPANPWLAWFAVGLFAVLLAMGGWWFKHRAEPVEKPEFVLADTRIFPLTGLSGKEDYPAFSPDGKLVAYTWDGGITEGNRNIYVASPGNVAPRRLTTNRFEESKPVWSPDGRSLAFLRQDNDRTEVIVLSLDKNEERSLGTVLNGLDWSPDGQSLAITDRPNQERLSRIYLVAVTTGERRLVTNDSLPLNDASPAFSPDGKELAFCRVGAGQGDLYRVSTTGGPVTRLTSSHWVIDSLDWSPDGRKILFTSNRSGVYGLWKINLAGGEPVAVPVEGPVHHLSVSRTGQLAYAQINSDSNIWKISLSNVSQPPQRLAASTEADDSPSFSPDGTKIAYATARSGRWQIWVCDADGSHPHAVTSLTARMVGTPRWSPDSQRIAFDVHQATIADIYVMNADGSQPVRLTDGQSIRVVPSWSQDGKWLYFCLLEKNIRQLWKLPATGGTAIQVTQKGGWEGFESADGTTLFYTKGRNLPGIWSVPTGGGEEKPVPELAEAARQRYWAVTKGGIYFVASGDGKTWHIKYFDLTTRRVREVTTLDHPPMSEPAGLAVSPDEKSLLFVQDDLFQHRILVTEQNHP
ncbi:MAG: DPP IV N-terminal domain-containing protein [Blastocatellia bacterium]|nr:DPP IV N-terminal domain-containing protein [Blastocatellia bacterium]